MLYTQSDRMFTACTRERREEVPMHNRDETFPEQSRSTDDPSSSSSQTDVENDGTWGERDVGGPVDLRHAMQEYEEMRRELTALSKTRSTRTERPKSRASALRKISSRASRRSRTTAPAEDEDSDVEAQDGERDADDFQLGDFLKDGHFEKRREGRSAKKVGVVYKNLTVEGVGATEVFVKTLPGAILGTFGPDLYKLLSRFIPFLPHGAQGKRRALINDFSGVVRDGEMLLVLGRPGSGCSTFLKAISNERGSFAGVKGDVSYGGIPADEQKKKYRGEVNYNEEDDQHLPTLTAFVRGVSGGERKRVSIAETLATKSTVVSWDNSTRGLDASTALDYANSLRVMTDISNRTTLVTLYQAGEGIYELMDKVLVIDEGRMVYQGPANQARKYFKNLGYYAPDRQTTADFLTSCTDPTERRFQEDFQGPIPKGPVELEKAFRESEAYKHVLDDIESYEKMLSETDHADAREFVQAVEEGKSKTVSKRSPYTVSFIRQVLACTKREFWLTWAFIIISNALIVASLFYGTTDDSAGAFSRGGTLFFSILFLGWLQLSELMKAVSGRPSAVVIARVVQDIPLIFVQVIPFSIVMYFLTGLDVDYYVNPIAYSFEAVLTNQFYGKVLDCAPEQTVPRGPGYDNPAYQGCAITGAQVGSLRTPGPTYLQTTYEYSRSNLWRNFGVVIAFTVLYILVTSFGSEVFNFTNSGGGALEFKRSKSAKNKVDGAKKQDDEEKGESQPPTVTSRSSETLDGAQEEEVLHEISGSESVFTWENVEYTVPTADGDRKLLNKVNGYAKPGIMVALMGASGAGKTTLLNTLSQRQSTGVVTGDMLVDGRPLDAEFQRGTGFCEQMDLHDGTQSIEEALRFSALLRQDRSIPREEKLAYVEKILDLLELRSTKDALVRSLGVEQRKRVTIGVELAAKPNLLLFLDEPTSGLDSQSAYNIVRFLKKLARAGQAIVCTIHQPSSLLIQEFDMILALNPGGNTFYFGPVGDNGSAVTKYFAERGVDCPPSKNVAEFILETAAKGGKRKDGKRLNWNEEWLNSEEFKNVNKEIERVKSERSKIETDSSIELREFASPVLAQTIELTKRLFIQYWRDPSYLYGKLFVSVIIGIFNGFTFWQLGNTIADMQNRMFTCFLIILIPPTIVNGVVPKFYQNRAIWEARELPSKIYGWQAFCTANVLAEIPIAILGGTIYWALWYWPAGLPTDSSTAGYVYLMSILFFLFQASWGQWICAFAPSFTVISNVLPFFFVMVGLFNGVIGGNIAATLSKTRVQCDPVEAAYFNPPAGSTCSSYASAFVTQVGQGYLTNPDATTNCGYCQYASGVEYMATLNVKPSDKWRDFGIFLAFCISNWALVYFFIYTVRIKGWSFGFGTLFGLGGKVIKAVKGLFKSKKGKKVVEE
ncbi:putative ATP-dependent permease PDR12 [Glarea lozoyensis 74030]|uniref:Putative ATP-dependent permease PDR12 n=1 Tax=Glarea lozoyensis (strain ATCC 74030 / MF5533) TaxID=1104152 RepID=H0ERT0_GLAL7|nr:putative ATP-dependent permease PDR12 [Glarea lozoyensis 74030]